MTILPCESSVILVEDDLAQARLYDKVLRDAFGSEITLRVFSDSSEAAAYIDTHLVDVLITDLRMPNVDGLELIQRAKDRFRGVQVLVMTAFSTPDSLLKSVDLGAADYLLKPFRNEVLIELVTQALQRHERWRASLSLTLHQHV